MSSDFFGISPAIVTLMERLFESSRGTGRTTSLLEQVKDGDAVVFVRRNEGERFERECRGRGVRVSCIVIHPRDAGQLPSLEKLRGFRGRLHFDHEWIESYYLERHGDAAAALSWLQDAWLKRGPATREERAAPRAFK